jgi:CTP:molybdopterin cytidylyltransferase MocA
MKAAIVLSAGASRRMGRPKALIPLPSGETFLSRIVRLSAAAGLQVVVVVGPPHGELIRAAPLPTPPVWVWNSAPERGMLSSVQAAVRSLAGGCRGALIWPVDVPLVAEGTVEALLSAGSADPDRIVVPVYEGRGGHPIWVGGAYLGTILTLSDTLRQLFQAHPHALLRLPVADPAVWQDFDTPSALADLQK